MTKFKVPELPSDEEMLAIRDAFLIQAKSPEVREYYIGVHIGQSNFKSNYASKHRDAAVVAIEALESYGCSCFYLNDMSTNYETVKKTCIFCIASEKIKKIYEQKEK